MRELFDQTEALQNLLVSQATGGLEDDAEFMRLRQAVLSQAALESHIPRFLRTCRNLSQFWQFIKHQFGTYAERRAYLWKEFGPMLELLERTGSAPSDQVVSIAIEKFDAANIQAAWQKRLKGALLIPKELLLWLEPFLSPFANTYLKKLLRRMMTAPI